MDILYSNYTESDFEVVTHLVDVGEPYSCAQWGNAADSQSLPILEIPAEDTAYSDWLAQLETWPSYVIFDKFGYILWMGSHLVEGDGGISTVTNLIDSALSLTWSETSICDCVSPPTDCYTYDECINDYDEDYCQDIISPTSPVLLGVCLGNPS